MGLSKLHTVAGLPHGFGFLEYGQTWNFLKYMAGLSSIKSWKSPILKIKSGIDILPTTLTQYLYLLAIFQEGTKKYFHLLQMTLLWISIMVKVLFTPVEDRNKFWKRFIFFHGPVFCLYYVNIDILFRSYFGVSGPVLEMATLHLVNLELNFHS